MAIINVDIQKSYHILNHGATTIVSAEFEGVKNAMAVTWACPLDYDKVTIVPHNGSFTRTLIEKADILPCKSPSPRKKICF